MWFIEFNICVIFLSQTLLKTPIAPWPGAGIIQSNLNVLKFEIDNRSSAASAIIKPSWLDFLNFFILVFTLPLIGKTFWFGNLNSHWYFLLILPVKIELISLRLLTDTLQIIRSFDLYLSKTADWTIPLGTDVGTSFRLWTATVSYTHLTLPTKA